MVGTMLRAKLHQARVTGGDINYVGSITIDEDLLRQAGMYVYEKVLVVNIENGARFETYTIPGAVGSGAVELNGAAARLASIGDRVIIMAFTQVPLPPPAGWEPRVVVLDEENRVVATTGKEVPSDAAGD
jgi:aspartate 1-decarboxylase